ncbi:MAG: prolyl oligopeptidase family serine peptidase [Acidobacteriota bacterium]
MTAVKRPSGKVTLALLLVALALPAALRGADRPPAIERYLAQPAIASAALAPAGDRLAYLLREEFGASLWLLDTASGEKRRRLAPRRIDGVAWSADGEGLFLELGERIAYVPVAAGRPFALWRFDERIEQRYQGPHPVLPGAALVTEFDEETGRHRLLRVGLEGERDVLWQGEGSIVDFLFDPRGQLAWLAEVDGLERVIRRVENGAVGAGPEILRCGFRNACALVAARPDGASLVLRRRIEEDLWGLTEFDLRTAKERPMHRDPRGLADLATVILEPASGQPVFAVHHTEARRIYALDASGKGHLERLAARFAGSELWIEPRFNGGSWWVMEAGAGTHHPRHHLYDPASDRLREILREERSGGAPLPAVGRGRQQHLSYRASDGRLVHGFLTLPAQGDPGTAPLVVKVHGGPWNHVQSGWDSIAQFLADRGYLVFEPNFRASTGYGLSYMLAGGGDFGNGRVQQDILDGVDHLLGEGYGDAERVGILGHSFGGFSTLGALAFTPRRFRAGIASAPPIDLLRTLRAYDDEATFAGGMPLKRLLRTHVFDFENPEIAAHLRSHSPEHHLAATQRPLLMVAGARDVKVDIAEVRHYAAALDNLGRDVSLLVDDESGHSFEDPRLRRAYLYLIERFFGLHLGGRVVEEADPDLERYLEANLRLAGTSLRRALKSD